MNCILPSSRFGRRSIRSLAILPLAILSHLPHSAPSQPVEERIFTTSSTTITMSVSGARKIAVHRQTERVHEMPRIRLVGIGRWRIVLDHDHLSRTTFADQSISFGLLFAGSELGEVELKKIVDGQNVMSLAAASNALPANRTATVLVQPLVDAAFAEHMTARQVRRVHHQLLAYRTLELVLHDAGESLRWVGRLFGTGG